MDHEEKIIILPVSGEVPDHIKAMLMQAMTSSTVNAQTLDRLIDQGDSVYRVEKGGSDIAAFMLRLDAGEVVNEAVIVAAGASVANMDLTGLILPFIESQLAGKCQQVRIHTSRKGMVRKLVKQGYVVDEMVLRKGI